ncbi:MAG: helix-turn-helix transcriptional regulator [Candidatus Izemoplasmatales bacterium]|nr:helix-turn-helix transcriptional regulator [Candidatus Izemoplasmatales bacterium]
MGDQCKNEKMKYKEPMKIVPRDYLRNQRKYVAFKSMEAVAEEIGVSYEYYAQLENGNKGRKLSINMILKLTKALGFTSCYRLVWQEKKVQEAMFGTDMGNKKALPK